MIENFFRSHLKLDSIKAFANSLKHIASPIQAADYIGYKPFPAQLALRIRLGRAFFRIRKNHPCNVDIGYKTEYSFLPSIHCEIALRAARSSVPGG